LPKCISLSGRIGNVDQGTHEVASIDAGEAAFATPTEYRSTDGKLFVTMEVRPKQVRIGKTTVSGDAYSGVSGGPGLWLRPGDTLQFTPVAHLAQITTCTSTGWRG
jgi:hypothetical protein